MKKFFEEPAVDVLKLEALEDTTVGGPSIGTEVGGDDDDTFD